MVWEIETRVNGQVVTFLVRPLQLPVAYMKANPEINSFNFTTLKHKMRDDNFALDIWQTRRPCRGFRLH